jgi:hypothetical protein
MAANLASVPLSFRPPHSFAAICWMALPKQRRNQDELDKQIRRVVDRALRDFREDSEAFGRSK